MAIPQNTRINANTNTNTNTKTNTCLILWSCPPWPALGTCVIPKQRMIVPQRRSALSPSCFSKFLYTVDIFENLVFLKYKYKHKYKQRDGCSPERMNPTSPPSCFSNFRAETMKVNVFIFQICLSWGRLKVRTLIYSEQKLCEIAKFQAKVGLKVFLSRIIDKHERKS